MFPEQNISDELATLMTMPLMSPGSAQYARFMYNGQAVFSKFFTEGFDLMNKELDNLLKTRNKTVLQLFKELAIE